MTQRLFLIDRDLGSDFAPTHRLTTAIQENLLGLVPAGTLVVYDGPPNFKFQPCDADAEREWLETTADPTRSNIYRGRSMPGRSA